MFLLSKSTLTDLFLKKKPLLKSTRTDLFLKKKPFLKNSSFFPCDVAKNSNIQIKLKLVFRKSDGKILFAQGEEDFADFLFSFLTYPLGAVIRVLRGNSSLGSVDGLYKSIADLNENKYLMSNKVKTMLLDPRLAPQFKLTKQILPIYGPYYQKYYCYYHSSGLRESIVRGQFSISNEHRDYDSETVTCTILNFVDPKSSTGSLGGHIKGPAAFMATDDLIVAPVSPISVISLLRCLGETTPGDLKEIVVTIGVKEGLSILKAALTCDSALTNGLGHLLTKTRRKNENRYHCAVCL